MEVVPTAVRSGATQPRRQRHNELDELEDELLRSHIRQHFGSSTSSHATTTATRQCHRRKRERGRYRDSAAVSETREALTGGAVDAFDVASAALAAHRRLRLSDAFKRVKRLVWFSDEDMSEEINASDPKIMAGKQFLHGVDAFSMLSENELAQLVGLSELRTFASGDVVLHDERESDGLYIVVSGTAARFPLPTAVDVGDQSHLPATDATDSETGDEYASESFGYQDHFGSIISPTEAAQTERGEAAVVATSDALECLWIPELVLRLLNVQPRMEYEFALVLHNHTFLHEAHHRAQEELVVRLLRAGVHVTVLANTRHTTNYIVLLLSAPLWLLAREDKLLTMERVVEHQSAEETALLEDESYETHAETLSASDRIAAFASILTRSPSDKPPGVGLQGIEANQNAVVKDVFPLHDPSMTDFILSTWSKQTLSAATARLFLLRMKDYFGLRIAFYAAFVRLYNAALVYPASVGGLLWVFWRWIHYRTYVKALGLYGLGVAFVWAPAFVKRWLRYQNSLLVEWNLLGASEVALPNRQFHDFLVETINVAAPHEPPDYIEVKSYDHRRRWPKYAIFALFCFVCLVLLFVLVGIYVQWYIIAVMTPMCTDPRCPRFLGHPGGCEAHCLELVALGRPHLFLQQISSCASYCNVATFDRAYYTCDAPLIGCFETERGILGTARWVYVLLQGIVLGLTLDIVFLALFEAIARGFNDWENYATEQEKERRFIAKIFLFHWVGYFYWFLLLAFVYVPNGARVQDFIRAHVDNNWLLTLNESMRFSRYWVDGLIAMDSAFVTPMIVTQALNLVINTFVPFLLRRAIVQARDSYHVKKERLSTALRAKKPRPRRMPYKPGFNSLEAALEASAAAAESELNVLQDVDTLWLSVSDFSSLRRDEVASMLAQREPVKAEQLESSVRSLFGGISSHDSHMQDICGGLSAEDLDSHQRTSYAWIDRVTRNIEERGSLKGGVWQSPTTTTAEQGGASSSAASASSSSLQLQLITQWQCRNYLYTADRVLEESSMPIYSPFGDLLHLAIQFSYTTMFSVVWPFCCLCSFARNFVAQRFDAIKMTMDCKRPIPRRTIGIGSAWLGALLFEILVAQVVVPGLFVYVSGQLDAFYDACALSETRYGPTADAEAACGLDYSARLQAFVVLENVGIVVVFVLYLVKSDISDETSLKIVAHSRRLKHHVRKSVRMIGETVLVAVAPLQRAHHHHYVEPNGSPERSIAGPHSPMQLQSFEDATATATSTSTTASGDPNAFFAVDLSSSSSSSFSSSSSSAVHPLGTLHRRQTQSMVELAPTMQRLNHRAGGAVVEWREGTVAWVTSGRLKVNFSGGRQLSQGGLGHTAAVGLPPNESEVWLANQETYVVMEPTPVQIFEVGIPVLLASKKFGRWTEASVVALDTRDRFGKEISHAPNEMHVRFVEGQNLRTTVVRQAGLMDPYCVLTVGGTPAIRHSSSVKRSTLNPVWDEAVVFPLSERELYGLDSGEVKPPSTVASRHASHVVLDQVAPPGAVSSSTCNATQATLAAAALQLPHSGVAGRAAVAPRRTLKVSVFNNDPFAMGECVGELELDLHQLRSAPTRHRVLVPLSHKRHVWTLDAVQSVMRKQAQGGAAYPMRGLPHLLVELQWIDTRLPTKVTVRVKGQPQSSELTLSRKFCETNLCVGVDADRVVHAAGGVL